jgi:predicted transposase YdaD
LEILIARNAESVKAESRKIKQALDLKNVETVTNALSMGLTVEQSAKLANVSVDFVKSVQQQLSAN